MSSRNPAGRTPGTHCIRGHEMATWRRRRKDGSGHSYCLACKRERNRNGMRMISVAAQMERLLRDGLSTTNLAGFRQWQTRVWRFFESIEAVDIRSDKAAS
jgi:hypothetical protein